MIWWRRQLGFWEREHNCGTSYFLSYCSQVLLTLKKKRLTGLWVVQGTQELLLRRLLLN